MMPAMPLVNFAMRLAQAQETVTVTGEVPLIDTKMSELTGDVDPAQVQQLALNGRNWLDLVSMVPGARGVLGDIRASSAATSIRPEELET